MKKQEIVYRLLKFKIPQEYTQTMISEQNTRIRNKDNHRLEIGAFEGVKRTKNH